MSGRSRVAALLVAVSVAAAGCSDGPDGGTAGGAATAGAGATAAAGLVASSAQPAAGPSAQPAAEPSARPSATSTIGLVDGFPTDLVPVLPGARVTSSAVSVRGGRVEVSLSGTTGRSRRAVLAFYGRALEKAGFTRARGEVLAPGTAGQVYARGDDVLVVAVVDGARRSFSVGGTVSVTAP